MTMVTSPLLNFIFSLAKRGLIYATLGFIRSEKPICSGMLSKKSESCDGDPPKNSHLIIFLSRRIVFCSVYIHRNVYLISTVVRIDKHTAENFRRYFQFVA